MVGGWIALIRSWPWRFGLGSGNGPWPKGPFGGLNLIFGGPLAPTPPFFFT